MCLICTEPLRCRSRSRNGDSGDWDRSHAGPCRFCSLIPTENWFKRWSLESHEVSITCQFCFLSSLCKPHHLHEATVELDPCYHSTRTQMPRWTRCSNLFQLVPTGSNWFQLVPTCSNLQLCMYIIIIIIHAPSSVRLSLMKVSTLFTFSRK